MAECTISSLLHCMQAKPACLVTLCFCQVYCDSDAPREATHTHTPGTMQAPQLSSSAMCPRLRALTSLGGTCGFATCRLPFCPSESLTDTSDMTQEMHSCMHVRCDSNNNYDGLRAVAGVCRCLQSYGLLLSLVLIALSLIVGEQECYYNIYIIGN